MPALTCPVPDNINALTTNGFLFTIQKYPELVYFTQSVNLPDVSLGISVQASSVHDLKIPGDTVEFGDLQIEFIVDSRMENYLAIYDWIVGLGFPAGHTQFAEYLTKSRNNSSYTRMDKLTSDSYLTILDANNLPVKRFAFHDAFPTSLSALSFQSVNNDTTYTVAQLNMVYSYFVPE